MTSTSGRRKLGWIALILGGLSIGVFVAQDIGGWRTQNPTEVASDPSAIASHARGDAAASATAQPKATSLSTVQPISPRAGEGTGIHLLFEWRAPEPASRWQFEVSSTADFQDVIRGVEVPGTGIRSKVRIEPLARDGQYYWRVKTTDLAASTPVVFVHDYYFERGRIALRQLDADRAIEMFARSEQDYTPELDLLREQAAALVSVGDPGAALRRLRVVLRLDDADVESRVMAGRAEVSLGRLEEGAEEFNHALSLDPEHNGAQIGLAWLDYYRGRFARALARVESVLDRDPRSVDALELAAITSINTDQALAAKSYLDRTLELEPRHSTALLLSRALARGVDLIDFPLGTPIELPQI